MKMLNGDMIDEWSISGCHWVRVDCGNPPFVIGLTRGAFRNTSCVIWFLDPGALRRKKL